MKRPALCIDAYLTDEARHQVLSDNISNFVKAGWDVFVISNKINHFNRFDGIKYFEYDSTNRILPNRHRYELSSNMYFNYTLYDNSNKPIQFHAKVNSHGFTNWTLLHNTRKMAEIVQRFGHTHFIRCEYDILFKNYDLMSTMYREFGTTPESLQCMVHPDALGFGCRTYSYLMGVDTVLNTIPLLNTEDDYEQFLIQTYGRPNSPVYEKLIEELFVKYVNGTATGAHLISDADWDAAISLSSSFNSAGDTGNTRRAYIVYDSVFICPVNDNTQLFVWNRKDTDVFLEYSTGNPSTSTSLRVRGHTWFTAPISHSLTVVTSDMVTRHEHMHFDLINGWDGYATFT